MGLGFAHLVTSMVGAGIAALALACLWRHDAVVRLLLKSRARPEQRDHGGQSLGLLFEDCSVLWVLAEDAHLSLFTFAEMHRSLGVLSTSHPGHDGDSTDVLFLALALPQTPG